MGILPLSFSDRTWIFRGAIIELEVEVKHNVRISYTRGGPL